MGYGFEGPQRNRSAEESVNGAPEHLNAGRLL
jgi:hypothetical protein